MLMTTLACIVFAAASCGDRLRFNQDNCSPKPLKQVQVLWARGAGTLFRSTCSAIISPHSAQLPKSQRKKLPLQSVPGPAHHSPKVNIAVELLQHRRDYHGGSAAEHVAAQEGVPEFWCPPERGALVDIAACDGECK
jgi:hypothetical protein